MKKKVKFALLSGLVASGLSMFIAGCATGNPSYFDGYNRNLPSETIKQTDKATLDGKFNENIWQGVSWHDMTSREENRERENKNLAGFDEINYSATVVTGEKGIYLGVKSDDPILYVGRKWDDFNLNANQVPQNAFSKTGFTVYFADAAVTAKKGMAEIGFSIDGDVKAVYYWNDGRTTYYNVSDILVGVDTKGVALNSENAQGYAVEAFIPWTSVPLFEKDYTPSSLRATFASHRYASVDLESPDERVRCWELLDNAYGHGWKKDTSWLEYNAYGVKGAEQLLQGHVFGSLYGSDLFPYADGYDLSNDVEGDGRKVTFSPSKVSSAHSQLYVKDVKDTQVYAEVRFKINKNDRYEGDKWPMFGMAFYGDEKTVDGQTHKQAPHFGIALNYNANPAQPQLADLHYSAPLDGADYTSGRKYFDKNKVPFDPFAEDGFTMAVYRNGTDFYFYINGILENSEPLQFDYVTADVNTYVSLFVRNIGMEITDYVFLTGEDAAAASTGVVTHLNGKATNESLVAIENNDGNFEVNKEYSFTLTLPNDRTLIEVKVNGEVVEADNGQYSFTYLGKTVIDVLTGESGVSNGALTFTLSTSDEISLNGAKLTFTPRAGDAITGTVNGNKVSLSNVPVGVYTVSGTLLGGELRFDNDIIYVRDTQNAASAKVTNLSNHPNDPAWQTCTLNAATSSLTFVDNEAAGIELRNLTTTGDLWYVMQVRFTQEAYNNATAWTSLNVYFENGLARPNDRLELQFLKKASGFRFKTTVRWGNETQVDCTDAEVNALTGFGVYVAVGFTDGKAKIYVSTTKDGFFADGGAFNSGVEKTGIEKNFNGSINCIYVGSHESFGSGCSLNYISSGSTLQAALDQMGSYMDADIIDNLTVTVNTDDEISLNGAKLTFTSRTGEEITGTVKGNTVSLTDVPVGVYTISGTLLGGALRFDELIATQNTATVKVTNLVKHDTWQPCTLDAATSSVTFIDNTTAGIQLHNLTTTGDLWYVMQVKFTQAAYDSANAWTSINVYFENGQSSNDRLELQFLKKASGFRFKTSVRGGQEAQVDCTDAEINALTGDGVYVAVGFTDGKAKIYVSTTKDGFFATDGETFNSGVEKTTIEKTFNGSINCIYIGSHESFGSGCSINYISSGSTLQEALDQMGSYMDAETAE